MNSASASIFIILFSIATIFALATIAVAHGLDGYVISGSAATIGAIAGYYSKHKRR